MGEKLQCPFTVPSLTYLLFLTHLRDNVIILFGISHEISLFILQSIREHPFRNSGWVQCPFLIWEPAFFCKVKEIRHLSGGVVLYAAQSNVQIDAEIAEKGGFRTETRAYARAKAH
jgi:hypothetical protein